MRFSQSLIRLPYLTFVAEEMELELGELSSTELRILLKWRNVRDEFLVFARQCNCLSHVP